MISHPILVRKSPLTAACTYASRRDKPMPKVSSVTRAIAGSFAHPIGWARRTAR